MARMLSGAIKNKSKVKQSKDVQQKQREQGCPIVCVMTVIAILMPTICQTMPCYVFLLYVAK